MSTHSHVHTHPVKSSAAFYSPESILLEMGLKNDETFLDAGCGGGHIAVVAAQIVGDNGAVYGIDANEDGIAMLDAAIKENGLTNVWGIVSDITKELPVPPQSIDLCLLSNVFHGLVANGEIDDFLTALFPALKKDGRLVVVDFKPMESPRGPPLEIRNSVSDVIMILSTRGFRRIKIFEAGEYHYGIVFSRQ